LTKQTRTDIISLGFPLAAFIEELMAAIITLTTDFGSKDAFAASMKGVILKINPQVQIVDISNEINPQDIWEAAYTLKSAYTI
jgi:S-adenosylmethionine hydrolase